MVTDSEKAFEPIDHDAFLQAASALCLNLSINPGIGWNSDETQIAQDMWQAGQAYGEQQAIERVLAVIDEHLRKANNRLGYSGNPVFIKAADSYLANELTNLRNEIQESADNG